METIMIILKVGNEIKGKASQGEMRILRDSGYAEEHPDHSFTLTENGREILRAYRIGKNRRTDL